MHVILNNESSIGQENFNEEEDMEIFNKSCMIIII